MDVGNNFAVIFGQYSIPIHFVFGRNWFLHFRFSSELRYVGQRSMSSSNRFPCTASHTSCRALSGPIDTLPALAHNYDADQHNGQRCWSRLCCCNRCYLRLQSLWSRGRHSSKETLDPHTALPREPHCSCRSTHSHAGFLNAISLTTEKYCQKSIGIANIFQWQSKRWTTQHTKSF